MPAPAQRTVVFAGPSLGQASADRWGPLIQGLELRPPAQRGDVLAALTSQPTTIVLLDGYFYTVPAVTHKEILYALESGVRVIGAASMGALRAAEMASFGMEGVGRIFRWFRDGDLDGDDEVALLHAPRQLGYRPLTLALVEIRHALGRLVDSGELGPHAAERLILSVKGHAFQDRTPARFAELAGRQLGAPLAAELERILATESIKSDDACQALLRARRPGRAGSCRGSSAGGYLSSFKECYVRGPAAATGGRAPSLVHAGQLIQMLHRDAPSFLSFLRRRFALAAAVDELPIEADAGRTARLADLLHRAHKRRFGRAILPSIEYRLEAEVQARAEAAAASPGGSREALAALAKRYGLAARDQPKLLGLVAGQPESLTPWWIARSLAFTLAFEPALAAASIAEEVRESFQVVGGGRPLRREDLLDLAREIWPEAGDDVGAAGRGRGLVASPSLSEGLFEGLELLALGRRFGPLVGDFDALCECLAAAPLDYPLPKPGSAQEPSNFIALEHEGGERCLPHR